MVYQGQPVIYRDTSTEYHTGLVAGNISGSNADLIVFSNGDTWSGGQTRDSAIIPQWGCSQGTAVGDWLPAVLPYLNDTFTVANNSRSIGTAFQPSTTRPVLFICSVRIVSALTISGGAAGRCELLSDSSATPTTVRARVAGGCTGTVVVGVSLTDTAEATMAWLVPTGDYVKLATTNETGTPTFTLTAQWELTL
jgi:hypothetical protein